MRDDLFARTMAEQNAAAVVCAACHKPIERGRGRYSVDDRHYHPDCYDREQTRDGTEAERRHGG